MKLEGYNVFLVDDGTIDTVISVNGCGHAYSQEYAAQYRHESDGALTDEGFKSMAIGAVEDHLLECELGVEVK